MKEIYNSAKWQCLHPTWYTQLWFFGIHLNFTAHTGNAISLQFQMKQYICRRFLHTLTLKMNWKHNIHESKKTLLSISITIRWWYEICGVFLRFFTKLTTLCLFIYLSICLFIYYSFIYLFIFYLFFFLGGVLLFLTQIDLNFLTIKCYKNVIHH